MFKTLQVRWTIIPDTAPQPWMTCSGCGTFRAFRCSRKIRLNANGRKLDAWLLYNCMSCGKTWNRTIFERRNVRDIDPGVLEALHSNDPDWILAEAFNLDALRRKAQRVDEFPDFRIAKQVLNETVDWEWLEIELALVHPVCIRLDRLLASELGISRSRLVALHENALLRSDPDRVDILRRRVRSGTRIRFDLSGQADRDPVWRGPATGAVSGR